MTNWTVTPQGVGSSTSGSGAIVVSPSANIAAGSVIIACSQESLFTGGLVTGSFSDDAGNTYVTPSNGKANPGGSAGNGVAQVSYVINALALTTSQHITYTKASNSDNAVVTIFSAVWGGSGSPALDKNPAVATGTGTAVTATSATTTANDALCVGVVGVRSSAISITSGGSFTTPPTSEITSTESVGGGNFALATAGSIQYTATLGSSQSWAALFLDFIGSGTSYSASVAQGSYTLTGKAINGLRSLRAIVAQGAYTLTGEAASFLRTKLLLAGMGAYTLLGQAITLHDTAIRMAAATGFYVLTGFTSAFTKVSHTLRNLLATLYSTRISQTSLATTRVNPPTLDT